MHAPQIVYCLGAFFFIGYLISRAENKWFISAIFLWLFSTPILGDQYYPIAIHFAGVDFQPNRLLFLFFFAVVCIIIVQARAERKSLLDITIYRLRYYELWMIVYISITILTIVFNYSELGAQAVVVNTIKLLTFLLVYFFSREHVSPADFRLLAIAIVSIAALSAMAGVYQFFGDPNFFRVGAIRPAFGVYMRANGFFYSEYEQGIFLTIALIIGMLTIDNDLWKTLMVATLPAGVFFTMHRASWAILAVALGMILIRDFRKTYLWIFTSAIVAVFAAFLVMNTQLQRNYTGSFLEEMINVRVEDNTWDVRLTYNQFAIDMLQKYPLGIGDYTSGIYYRETYKMSLDFMEGTPLIVHNGFLSAGVVYGVAGMVSFILFIISLLIHYLKKGLWLSNIGFMVALIMLSFFIINMTQDFSFLGDTIGLFFGLLIGASLSLSHWSENSRRANPNIIHSTINQSREMMP